MAFELKNISKSFDGKAVLKDFSLTIDDGKITAVMGESGSGKTTLLNLIAGLLEPDVGEINGLDNKKIGFVFQEDRLAENFTVYRNIRLACGKNVDKAVIENALTQTGLDNSVMNAKVSTLSGGMKRRVSIIRAVLCGCDILLLDEPTKGLDEQNKHLVIDFILEKAMDKTVIWVTHDEDEAKLVSDVKVVIE